MLPSPVMNALMPAKTRRTLTPIPAARPYFTGGTRPRGEEVRVQVAEHARRQLDPGSLELLRELRADAGRPEPPLHLAVDERGLLEDEDVLEDDGLALDALDLGDVRDLARAVLQPRDLHDDVERAGDLLLDGPGRQVDAGHEAHRLQAADHVARIVRVAGRQRAVVSGVHGLQHGERLTATDLTYDDPLGTHPEGVLDEVHDRHGALALDVRRARLEAHDVVLHETELRGVLDGDDALVLGDEARHDVEQRRLPGARTAGDEDVQARFDARAEELHHLRGRRAELDVVLGHDPGLRELPDGDDRTVQRERRDDDVHARAVREPRVLVGLRLVHPAADRSDDALDDAHDVVVVPKGHVREHELALALDVGAERPVHHDLGGGIVVQERLDRTEAEDLVEDLLEHLLALDAGDDHPVLFDEAVEHLVDRRPDRLHVGEVEPRIEVVDDLRLQLQTRVAHPVPGGSGRLRERAPGRRGGRLPAVPGRRFGGARDGGRGGGGAFDKPQKGHGLSLTSRGRARYRTVRRRPGPGRAADGPGGRSAECTTGPLARTIARRA